MATTNVQSALQAAGSSKAFAGNVTSGNLLTARIVWQGAAGITLNSVTDTQGNTWTIHASTLQRHPTLTQYMQIASCNAGSSAACTVTSTLSSGTAKSIAIDEWNNAAGQLTFDVGSANSGTSPTLNSGSATTTAANDLGIGMCAADASLGGSFITPSAGWTDQQSYTPYWYANDLYQLDLGTAGSESAGETLTSGASKNWMCNFASFKVSGGGGVALSSSAVAGVTGSGALSVAIPIVGASAAVATGQGTLGIALPLAAAGAASVVGSATLNTNQALASSAVAGASGQGTLGISQAISGSGIATAQGQGTLSLSIPISSSALVNAIGSGTLNGSVALSANAAAAVTGQGTISIALALNAAAIANAVGTGNLGVNGALQGAAVAAVVGQGSLLQNIPIQGASLAATNASGSLTQLVPIGGSSIVLASGQGALHLTVNMNAAALSQALSVGNLTLRIQLSGAAVSNAIGRATIGGMFRPVNPEYSITGNSLVRYVLGTALSRSL